MLPSKISLQDFFFPKETDMSLDDDGAIFYRYAREGLLDGFKRLNIGAEEEVLLPCLICEVVLDVFEQLDINIRYYGLTDQLQPLYSDIVSQINPNTRAIYINHPLGHPVSLEAYQQLCGESNLFLLEDCAHRFSSQINNSIRTNVLTLFSFRKLMPLPDGGVLVFNGCCNETRLSREYPHDREELSLIMSFIIRYLRSNVYSMSLIIDSLQWATKLSKKLYKRKANVKEEGQPLHVHSISKVSRYIFRHTCMSSALNRRVSNYHYIYQAVQGLTYIRPLFCESVEDLEPYSFPFKTRLVKKLLAAALRSRIHLEPTYAHVDLSRKNLITSPTASYDEVNYLADSIVSAPIHQDLERRDLEKIVDLLLEHNRVCMEDKNQECRS